MKEHTRGSHLLPSKASQYSPKVAADKPARALLMVWKSAEMAASDVVLQNMQPRCPPSRPRHSKEGFSVSSDHPIPPEGRQILLSLVSTLLQFSRPVRLVFAVPRVAFRHHLNCFKLAEKLYECFHRVWIFFKGRLHTWEKADAALVILSLMMLRLLLRY